MGNSSSTSSNSRSGESSTENGVSLSDRFQQDVLEDFQATLDAQARGIQQQQQTHTKANADVRQKHAQFMLEKNAVLAAGDKRWNELSARFEKQVKKTDAVASKLQDKYVKPSEILGNDPPCAQVRWNYAECQRKSPPGACTIYIQALQDCVTQAVAV